MTGLPDNFYLWMIKNIHMVIPKNNPITMSKLKFFVDFCSVDKNITTSFIQCHLWIVIIYQLDMLIEYTNAFFEALNADSWPLVTSCDITTLDQKWPDCKSYKNYSFNDNIALGSTPNVTFA